MNAYCSRTMWNAAVELARHARAGRLIGQYESELRRISERRAERLFEVALYELAPSWARVVSTAMAAIARRYGWTEATTFDDWMRLSDWLGLEHEDETRQAVAWAVRAARKWRDRHPGTSAVALASEWDDDTLAALGSWLAEITETSVPSHRWMTFEWAYRHR